MFPLCPALARRFAWLVVPLSLFAATAAWSGPKEDMKALSVKFLSLRSYHAVMQSNDQRMQKMEMDFVAPNRYRMNMPMGTQYVIGDTMYMTIDGRTMKIPMPKGTVTQWRESDRAFREMEQMQVEALGSDIVNGKPARKYRMTRTEGKTPGTTLLWVGTDGYPIKMETTGTAGKRATTMTVHYSRFNDSSIRIEPPK